MLIVQGLQQAHYEILSIIFQNKFMKSNTNMEAMAKKNVKLAELNISIAAVFLNAQILKTI